MDESIMLQVHEDAYGANGALSRRERIESLAERLVDYVHEVLAGDYDCGHGTWYGEPYAIQIPREAFRPIERLVAAAMIDQFEYDEKRTGELQAFFTGDYTPLPENPVIEPR
jgi:hypothetical protein